MQSYKLQYKSLFSHKLSFVRPAQCFQPVCLEEWHILSSLPHSILPIPDSHTYISCLTQSIKCFTNARRMPNTERSSYLHWGTQVLSDSFQNLETLDFLFIQQIYMKLVQCSKLFWEMLACPHGTCSSVVSKSISRECSFWHTKIILKDEDLGNIQ